jgi:hypothetical protein
MTQNEDQMDEATIDALANLETVATEDTGVVPALTQANARLVKQLEENTSELRELKAFPIRNGVTGEAKEVPPHLQPSTVGPMAIRWARLTQASPATPAILATKRRPPGLITWEQVRPTRNDVLGRHL